MGFEFGSFPSPVFFLFFFFQHNPLVCTDHTLAVHFIFFCGTLGGGWRGPGGRRGSTHTNHKKPLFLMCFVFFSGLFVHVNTHALSLLVVLEYSKKRDFHFSNIYMERRTPFVSLSLSLSLVFCRQKKRSVFLMNGAFCLLLSLRSCALFLLIKLIRCSGAYNSWSNRMKEEFKKYNEKIEIFFFAEQILYFKKTQIFFFSLFSVIWFDFLSLRKLVHGINTSRDQCVFTTVSSSADLGDILTF